jgi:hypothetical protein
MSECGLGARFGDLTTHLSAQAQQGALLAQYIQPNPLNHPGYGPTLCYTAELRESNIRLGIKGPHNAWTG